MFTVAFILLLGMAVGSLTFSINMYRSNGKELTTATPSPILPAVLILLACILALGSDFRYKLIALILMVFSIMRDYLYYRRRGKLKVTVPPPKRRLRWQLFDNSAWIAVVIMLYVVR